MEGKFLRMIAAVFITIIIAIYNRYNGSVNIGEGK